MSGTLTVDLGDVVQVTGTFTDNPTTVTAEYRESAATSTTPLTVAALDPVLAADGVTVTGYPYRGSFKPTTAGRYYVRMVGTGTNEAAEEVEVVVRRPRTPVS